MIRQTERATYEDIFALERYGDVSPGEQYLPLFLDMAKPISGSSVIDAGCGTGKGLIALAGAGLHPRGCDIADHRTPDAKRFRFAEAVLWDWMVRKTGTADYVYCCDVLEHIPTPFTMLTVARLLEVGRRGVFLSIATVPDHFGLWVGKPLHRTVQSFSDWRDQLKEVGRLVEARDLLTSGVFWLTN